MCARVVCSNCENVCMCISAIMSGNVGNIPLVLSTSLSREFILERVSERDSSFQREQPVFVLANEETRKIHLTFMELKL